MKFEVKYDFIFLQKVSLVLCGDLFLSLSYIQYSAISDSDILSVIAVCLCI
jgi:hypothetical protein